MPPRTLGFTALVGLAFFCVAGGAYGLEDAVGGGGPMLALLGILLLPWLWSYPTALMTAELSSAMPEDGGYVVWVERAFGRFWGFQEGWLSWLASFADNALYPAMFVDYLVYLGGDMAPAERWLIGLLFVTAITWLNVRGARLVGIGSVVFAILVLAPFAAMVVVGAAQVEPASWLGRIGKVDWALLLSTLLWNTNGWDNAGCCAGEVEEPSRTYHRAMVAALSLVMLAYLLPLGVGVGVDGNWGEWKDGYFPKVAAQIGGDWLGIWITAAGLVSAAGLFSALLCTSSRVSYAMALVGTLPAPLKKLHPRHGTPWIAILVNSIGVVLLLPFSFQELVQVDISFYTLSLILEFGALLWLRIKEPAMARPYRIPLGTTGIILLSLPPVALCLLSLALANNLTKLASAAGIALGLVVYGFFSRPKDFKQNPQVADRF